ncbi:HNH endonuclease [Pusillimonas sp. SM2304]|uniref:HNH endonuclease n=1 Tax=Pusillimonas sp. SM2304 TaxID=3073241 RepID=UPI002875E757|nr:HNH endonuclease [Pusillimonas sp. SM2304]MDS1138963.1 HNH endonuclease [Pusillimonas sp. SM2304]
MYPFIMGQEYARKWLLEFLGSRQAQSGVVWGMKEPGCLICTSGGRGGKRAGYFDESLDDGSWWYFGQGQSGDQRLENPANSKLASGRLSVLFFTTREPTAREVSERGGYGKLFAFRGEFNVAGYQAFVPREGRRKGDRLWRFRLVPTKQDEGVSVGPEEQSFVEPDIQAWQERLNMYAHVASESVLSMREYRRRSAEVHQYARSRANGMCEACAQQAPFTALDHKAFLEVHHLTRLADDGPDTPSNVAALCPNCHRRAHYSLDREQFASILRGRILAIESAIARRLSKASLVNGILHCSDSA